jgi:transposase
MNLLSHLLPDRTHVRLATWNLDPVHSAITVTLQARRTTARCPLCGGRSKRIHSRYERTLADLPWGMTPSPSSCGTPPVLPERPLRAPHFR